MTSSRLVRLHLPVAVLAATSTALALWFGGYHVRHAGWAAIALVAWACVQAARGRLSTPRSPGGIATIALVLLAAWTAASMSWADASRHDAWVETVRALMYAAAFVLGGSLLASARSFVRYTAWAAGGIALLAAATLGRMLVDDSPLKVFVAGRLDWPVGYAPGLAALHLVAALLLLGLGCSAERIAGDRPRRAWLIGGASLAGAGACASLALMAQSRGTLPALLVAAVVALVATPDRASWLLRAAAVGAALAAMWTPLAAPYAAQFALRQAPFTEGADPAALQSAAEASVREAALAVVGLALVLAIVGAALVPASRSVREWLAERGRGWSFPVVVPALVLVASLAIALVALQWNDEGTPGAWLRTQWQGCIEPPDTTGDPGASSSHFATTGTGRCDYYRVALGAVRDAPVAGLGAGNFRGEYVRERSTREEPRLVHSLPLQLLAELGVVGAALGALVLACVLWAVARFVGSGPWRDPAFAGAISAIAFWVVHASIDWLWQLPAVSIPAVVLAGGLVACVSPAQGRVRAHVGAPIGTGVLLTCIAGVLPVTMADARLRDARDSRLQQRDPAAAIEAAQDAQQFDPTWAEPWIAEASLRWRAKQHEQAARAARTAVELEPRSWSVQHRASSLIALVDREGGRTALRTARDLNPMLQAPRVAPPRAGAGGDPDELQAPVA